jgi:hypothetical protein
VFEPVFQEANPKWSLFLIEVRLFQLNNDASEVIADYVKASKVATQ